MASTPIPQSSKLKWTWPPLIRKENILQVNIEMRGKGEVPSMKLILKWYQLHLDYLSLTCNISSFHCLGKATVLSCNSRMRIGWWLSTYLVNICMLNCLGQATVLSCNSCKRIGWWLSTYLVNIWMLNCLGQATVLSPATHACEVLQPSERASERATAGGIEPGTSSAWVPQTRAERPHQLFAV